MKKPSKWIYIFGFLPGLGQMMLGLMNRGIQFMFLFWGSIFLAANSLESIMLFMPLLVFYAYFDALQRYREILETGVATDGKLFQWDFIQDKKKWIAWALIAFGGFSFINLVMERLPWSIQQYIPYDAVQQGIVIIIFIGLGIKLLRGEKEKENQAAKMNKHLSSVAIKNESTSSESGEK